jgi:hypothetical protein
MRLVAQLTGGVTLLGVALSARIIGCRLDTQVGYEVPSAPLYLEAEQGVLIGGFSPGNDSHASGSHYITAPSVGSPTVVGPASASYLFRVDSAGPYAIWGRVQTSDTAFPHNCFWVTVDDRLPATQWRLSTGPFWYWGPVTDGTNYGQPLLYTLDPIRLHKVVFSNCGDEILLDRIYIAPVLPDASLLTVGASLVPPNDNHCDPPNSIELIDGTCESSCGSQLGTACGTTDCQGFVPLPAYDCEVCCRINDAGTPANALPDAGDAGSE